MLALPRRLTQARPAGTVGDQAALADTFQKPPLPVASSVTSKCHCASVHLDLADPSASFGQGAQFNQ